jgi:hypothetical protein
MKKLLFISSVFLLLAGISCDAQSVKTNPGPGPSSGDVEVYYFHFTARCTTCKTIEAEARKNVEMLYSDQVKDGKITFTSLNLEEAAGKSVGDKLGVSGQTLLIVRGDEKINITNEGFLYAVAKPDKFQEIMKAKIDPLLVK